MARDCKEKMRSIKNSLRNGTPVFADDVRWLLDLNDALVDLVAIADAMYAENAAKAQAESDAQYQAEFGCKGPSLASPLDSRGRTYVYWRCALSRNFDHVPEARVALGRKAP